ncbi:MAG: hypothetical protein A3F77_18660 [Betaproteobacteria bacterium RIFCSPLOWO2_12_FULL_67_28]|nr:MAG: hypothetical protein A3F77_18660 [Betaproteobacteria bacterium RIFCSPLOWO2_12_FULL_67_28]
MGGGGGGGFSSDDLKRLEERAKKKLSDSKSDSSCHVFISFPYENADEVNLLRGQTKNENSALRFDDYSVKDAFESSNAEYIKRQIREKIDRCSVTLVYLSSKTASSRWVAWEIEESLKRGKGVVGVYQGARPPAQLPAAFRQHKLKTVKWSHAEIMKAIEDANKKR